jgi:hypothetical protein
VKSRKKRGAVYGMSRGAVSGAYDEQGGEGISPCDEQVGRELYMAQEGIGVHDEQKGDR